MKRVEIAKKILKFKFDAGTSRGVYRFRNIWYIVITDTETGNYGIGEAAPLIDLSCDNRGDYKKVLVNYAMNYAINGDIDIESLRQYPSILFALEMARLHLEKRSIKLFDNDFSNGHKSIPINGLVWMGDYDTMYCRLKEKIESGFKCIKIKIGAIDFNDEIALIKHIRKDFSPSDIEIRLDANGAFSYDDAQEKLKRLSEYTIHSIEQPIKAGQWDKMAKLCETSPIDIALDEELIGVNMIEEKRRLLEEINPKYIILKPTLHGGLSGSSEWIKFAKERDIEFWITSALESNIGLNAIAQFTAEHNPIMPQGLGTGELFKSNAPYPLSIEGNCLHFDASAINNMTNAKILEWVLNEGI